MCIILAPLGFFIVSALGFVFVVLTARVVYRFAVAWLLYSGLEARLVFFLWLRSALRLRFVLSPLGLHSACPFAHCPSAARFLALLVVPPPPEFAIVPVKAFGFLLCFEGR